MSDSVDDFMKCKVCSLIFCPPIVQCENGHSICGRCSKDCNSSGLNKCPICGSVLTQTRNRQLEEMIDKLKNVKIKSSCKFAYRGCKYELDSSEKTAHELQCKSRIYACEGATFCKWKCNWSGGYGDLLQHYKIAHSLHAWMSFKNDFGMEICMKRNIQDIHIIDFHEGQQLFLYKHKTDVNAKKAYWAIQYVGLEKQAAQFFYEFEIYSGVRKIKITEICESDVKAVEEIFKSERCVVLPFKTIKTYLDKNEELPIRFRVMKIKKEHPNSPV